jgi:hypothetical protein
MPCLRLIRCRTRWRWIGEHPSPFTILALPFPLLAAELLQSFSDFQQHKMPMEIHVLLNAALTGRAEPLT